MVEERKRTLDDSERRRLGAMMVSTVRGRPRSVKRGDVSSRGSGRGRVSERAAYPARPPVQFLFELPERFGSGKALCAATAGWAAGVALSLVFLEVVRW